MTIEELFKGHESSAEKHRNNWKMDNSIVAGYNLLWAQEQVKNRSSDYNDDTSYLLYNFISSSLCDHISLDDVYSYTMSMLNRIQVCKNVILFINKNKVYELHSSEFETDDKMGMCMDGDGRAVRYVNIEKGKTFKMKAGKFIKHIIEDYMKFTEFTVTEELSRYIQERFSAEWKATHNFINDKVDLVIDEDFESIYNAECCDGDFGSCMTGNDQYSFYDKSINCSAASIRNIETGLIMARCILYSEVHEKGTVNIWRLAERQYSKNGDLFLKQVLIDKLIEAGEIDGYKRVGASYDDSRDFVGLDGQSLKEKTFYVYVNLKDGDTLSYQDSFKFFDEGECIAYNRSEVKYDAQLGVCSSVFESQCIPFYYWDSEIEEYVQSTDCRSFIDNQCSMIGGEYYQDYVYYDGVSYLYNDKNVVRVDEKYVHVDTTVCIDGEIFLKIDCVQIKDKWYSIHSDDILELDEGGYALKKDAVVALTGEALLKTNTKRYVNIGGNIFYVTHLGIAWNAFEILKARHQSIDLEGLDFVLTKSNDIVRKDSVIQIDDYYIQKDEIACYHDEYVEYMLSQLTGFKKFCKNLKNEKAIKETV